MSKRSRRRANGRDRIHLTADESKNGRIRKKLIGKSSWYKNKNNKKNDNGINQDGRRWKGKNDSHGKQNLKTRAVLFVEQTPNGELARQIKELLVRLEPIVGFKLRVVERTGRSIQSQLPQSAIWRGSQCDREHCVTCQQGG